MNVDDAGPRSWRASLTAIAAVFAVAVAPLALGEAGKDPEHEILACNPEAVPRNLSAPSVSPTSGNVGVSLWTTAGTWDSCDGTVVTYQFSWLRSGSVIGGATGQGYTTVSADGGHSISSQVTACNSNGCSSPTGSSNSASINPEPPPPNNPPWVPGDRGPADGTMSTQGSPQLAARCTDPEGQNCRLDFEVYRDSDGALVAAGSTGWLGSGSMGYWTVSPQLAAINWYLWRVRGYDGQAFSGWSSYYAYYVDWPPEVSLQAPDSGADFPTATPVLSASANDPDGPELWVQFEIADNASFASATSSGWLPGGAATTWTVPPGVLKDGRTYYWRARVDDGIAQGLSGSRTLDVRLPKLGVRDYWPIWSRGPLAVNLATGNLVVAVPGPSYPTAASSMAASATFNSLDSRERGLGAGWTLAAGSDLASPPSKLVDHSLLSGPDRYDAVERVSADGSSDFYTRVGSTNTYLSAPGDGSRLTRAADGSWTLTDPDGAIYVFGSTHTSGAFPLVSAELADAEPGKGALYYTFGSDAGSPDPLRVTDVRDSAAGAPPGRTLAFAWNRLNAVACPDALLCVTGPDGVTWRYVGDGPGGTSGRLARVNNGTRDLLALTYDGSGRPVTVQNANDLDPANASPGYDGNHALTIAYDANGRVGSVSDGLISNQTPAASTWTFGYFPGSTPVTRATQAAHGSLPADTVRTAEGYSQVTPPRQQGQPTPKKSRVYYDSLAHPLEIVDLLGNVVSSHFNDKDQPLWTEDADGQPTDYAYDPVTEVLLSVTGPDPDGPGPLARPVTSYRYDETVLGTAESGGAELQGLQAWYYDNPDLAGRPKVRQTEPAIDANWGTGGPPALPGVTDNFAVRWTGNLVVSSAGSYVFTAIADDGVRVTIGDKVAIDRWPGSGQATTSSQAITLTAGRHKLTVDYHDLSGAAEMHLRWACADCTPAIAEELVPTSALRPAWLNQTSVVSPLGRISFSHFADPAAGHPDYTLQRLADGTNVITSFSYDDHGRVTQKVMPKGNATRTIDAAGNLQGTADARFATSWTYYAPAAEATTPAHGTCSAQTVNQAGQLRELATHGLTPITHIYDAAARPVSTTRGTGTTPPLLRQRKPAHERASARR